MCRPHCEPLLHTLAHTLHGDNSPGVGILDSPLNRLGIHFNFFFC